MLIEKCVYESQKNTGTNWLKKFLEEPTENFLGESLEKFLRKIQKGLGKSLKKNP